MRFSLPMDRQTQLHYSLGSGRVYIAEAVEDNGEVVELECRYNEVAEAWSVSTRRPRLRLEETREAIKSLFGNLGRALTFDVAKRVAYEIVAEAELSETEKAELREWYPAFLGEVARDHEG